MSDTMKAAWIGVGAVLLAALVTGVFTLLSSGKTTSVVVTDSPCANVNMGVSAAQAQHCEREETK